MRTVPNDSCHRRTRRWTLITAFVAAVVLGGSSVHASFVDPSDATGTLSTDVLAPPADLSAQSGTCAPDGTASVTLQWTASASTWADGYEAAFGTTIGGPYPDAHWVAGAGTTGTEVVGLQPSTTYAFVVKATRDQWRSSPTNEASATTPVCP